MAFIESDKIKVFPCISRDDGYDPESELMAEVNFARIIRAIYNRRYNFVVSKNTLGETFEVVVGGYCFEIDTTSSEWQSLKNGTLWGAIKTTKNAQGIYQELTIDPTTTSKIVYSDEDDYFKALYLSTEEPSETEYNYRLKILENGEIPATSLLYWSTDDFEDSSITTVKIADENVTREKIEDKAVNLSKIDFNLDAYIDTSNGDYRTLVIEFEDN